MGFFSGGGFKAGSIWGELQLRKTGWNQSVKEATGKDKTALTNAAGEIGKKFEGAGKKAGTASTKFAGLFTKMAVGLGGVIALRSAMRTLSNFMGDCITAAGDQESAMAQLDAVIKSTGGAAGLTNTQLATMAANLQAVTTYGDETIIKAESLLLTFTKIGKEVFPDALETVLDMSSALGQDLKASAIQLGKALNEPIEGVTALRRVGVSLNDQQQEMVKTLVESGDMLGAQKLILAELKTEFGGVARAMGETFTGRISTLENYFGDLKEQIGETIIKSEGFNEILGAINETVINLTDAKLLPDWLDVVAKGIDFFMEYSLFGAQLETIAANLKIAADREREFAEEGERAVLALDAFGPLAEYLGQAIGEIKFRPMIDEQKTLIPLLDEVDDLYLSLATDLANYKITVEDYLKAIGRAGTATGKFKDYLDDLEMLEFDVPLEESTEGLKELQDLFNSLGITVAGVNDDITEDIKTTYETRIPPVLSNFASNAGRTFGTFFDDLFDETSSFEEVWKNFADNLKTTFTSIISDMVYEWVENFIKKMVTSSAEAGADIAKNLASSVGGAGSGSISGAFGSVSTAAGGLLNTLSGISTIVTGIASVASLFKKSGPSSTDSWHFEHIWMNTKETRDWLFNNAQARLDEMAKALTGTLPNKSDSTRIVLRGIKRILESINKGIGGIPSGQGGLEMYTGNQTGLVRYHPRENISITPASSPVNVHMDSTPVYVSLDGRNIAMGVAKHMPRLSADGHMKFHQRGIVNRR